MGRRRLTSLVLATALLACVVSVSASASTSAGRPPGSPDLATMALALSDLPNLARVSSQGYYRDPDFVASYQREFSLIGSRIGRSRLLFLLNDLSVEPSAVAASATFRSLLTLLRMKAFRSALAREIAGDTEGVTVRSVAVGRPRTARIGDGAVSILIRVKAEGLSFQISLTFTRVDRVLGLVGFFGFPSSALYNADVDRLARVSAARVKAGLVPTLSAQPVVAGTPQPGQTLSATRGTWTGDELVFSYQWERCSEAGSGCAAIPGATAATYAVVPGDLASTLRVTVAGSNRLGSVDASSTATPVVTGPPGSPTVTVAPVIAGNAQAGETLTVDSGTWTGTPTTFTYQWRRCDDAGAACVDVAGATASTYAIAAADSRATLRVLVVATNAAGSGGTITAPTAAVP